jgi:DNA-3-methyladenine glycosylase I
MTDLPSDTRLRCGWAAREPNQTYHDTEWGTPLHDDRMFFEFLVLDGAQAGLSWETILKKRANYRAAFDNFEPAQVAAYDEARVAALLANPGIVRNKLKVASAVQNARAFLEVQREFGSFDRYIWSWVGGAPQQNAWQSMKEIPAKTPAAEALSKDLIQRGFKFVGPTIVYAIMQSAGLVNDHLVSCFRYAEVAPRRP